MRRLRASLAQINSTVGDLDGNAARIIEQIREAESIGADIVAFPELALTGYPPEDLVLRRGFVEDNLAMLDRVCDATRGLHVTAIVGFVDYAHDIFNAAAVIHDGQMAGAYHKQYLPNYGVFDEARYFRPGTGVQLFDIAGARVGVTICEDIWYSSGPMQDQCLAGAEVVVNINGSPFHAGKSQQREQMLATRASDNAVLTLYCNLVGGQDHLIFDGGSTVFGPGGDLIARAPMFREHLLTVDLDVEEVRQTRLHDPRLRRLPQTEADLQLVSGDRPAERGPALDAELIDALADDEQVYEALVLGTRDYVHKTGFSDVVIALSGGIDSTLTAVVAVDALGPDHVRGVSMPSRYSSEGSVADARALADNLGIQMDVLPIEGPYQANIDTLAPLFEGLPQDVTEENLQARIRGVLMMAISNKTGALVLTTSNKSESATGYTTLYGDMTGGLAVIQDVPKLLVYRLSELVNERAGREVIPVSVLTKPPSAELRPDQFDEQSLMPYERLDPILEAFVEEDRSLDEIVEAGFDEADVKRVMSLVTGAEYKRRQAAPGLRITPRAFGRDRRFPIANRYRGF
ncbi:MAG: NAD+ synthase [Chloroflexota bacterium]|nr:NAD+ synthase [Chloroflexota bacterium]